MTLPTYNNGYSNRPAPGQCWMCHRSDSVPAGRRDLVPELYGPACEAGWVQRYSLDGAVTHVVAADKWVPLAPSPEPAVDVDTEVEPVPVRIPTPGEWWRSVRARWAQ